MAVAGTLIGAGFGVALVQKRDLTETETSSVFYLCICSSFAMAGAMMLAAPWIAAFFDMPVLAPVSRVLSLAFIISSLGGVHTSLLAKNLQFAKLARISLSASAVSSLVAIFLAWNGWGIWSLVGQNLAACATTSLVVWIWSDWRPKLVFNLFAIAPLFRFGAYIVAADLLETIFGRIYILLIGKCYTPADLGYYSRADSTLALPNSFTSGIINQVAMPLFSAATHDPVLLQKAFRKAMRVTYYVHAPIMAGLFVAAEPLVLTLYGSQWVPAIPFVRILAFCGLCWLPVTVNYGYLKATGRSKAYFAAELAKKVLALGAAVLTVRISIFAMVASLIFVTFVAYLITARIAGGSVKYAGMRQILDAWKPLCAATLMIPVAASVLLLRDLSPGALLGAQVLAGGLFYLLCCRVLNCKEQSEVFGHLQNMLARVARR